MQRGKKKIVAGEEDKDGNMTTQTQQICDNEDEEKGGTYECPSSLDLARRKGRWWYTG